MWLGALLILTAAPAAHARTLWLAAGSSATQRAALEQTIQEVLAGSPPEQHVVGQAGLAEWLRVNSLAVPPCLAGTEPCENIERAIAAQLNLAMIVTVRHDRRAGTLRIDATGGDLEPLRSFTIEAPELRQALLAAVAELTGATGILVVESAPDGATVRLNGEVVGTTPWRSSLPVGTWEISLALAGHTPISERIEIAPDATVRRGIELEQQLARVLVRSGTQGAWVTVDDRPERLPLNEPFFVDPGDHTITVVAAGYNPVSSTFLFLPGEDREISATLTLSRSEVTRRARERLLARPLMLQVGLHYSHLRSDWRDARITADTADVPTDRIECSVRPNTGQCQRARANELGLDLELLYALGNLELQPFGVSVRTLGMQSSATDFTLRNDPALQLSDVSARRVQLRLAHVGYRYLANEYFEPYARAGFSLHFDRGRAEDLLTATGDYTWTRLGVALEARAGARLHINALLYAYADAGVAIELRHLGTRPAFEVAAGAGVNLPDPFGRTRRLEQQQQQRAQARQDRDQLDGGALQ